MRKNGIKMLAGWLFLAIFLALTGCGGGGSGSGDGGSSNSAPAGTFKLTKEMLSGNTYNISSGSTYYDGGKYIFNANGTVVFTYPGFGTGTNTWSITPLGQLMVSNDTFTPNSNSATVIPLTNQVGGKLTLTLVDTSAQIYKFTSEMISGKKYTFIASDGLSGTVIFNANGTATATTTNGAVSMSWLLNVSGQLKLTHSDGSYDILTPTSNSTSVIPCTDQYTDPAHPADNSTGTMTLTLVT